MPEGSSSLLPLKTFLEYLNQRLTGTVRGPTGRKKGSEQVSGTLLIENKEPMDLCVYDS